VYEKLNLKPICREEINNLQTNVEFLTTRFNSASTIIASNNVNNEAAYDISSPIYNTNTNNNTHEPIISSSTHSSPKNYTASIQPTATTIDPSPYTVDENYSIDNSYETSNVVAESVVPVTPLKSLNRTNSIKNISNDENLYSSYNTEPQVPISPSYVDPQTPAGKTN
jgi:hypothetical protein